MTTPYLSQQPVTDFSLNFSDLIWSASLATSTDTALTIPGVAPSYKALIKCTNPTWVALNAVAAVPSGASFATSTSELVNLELCREVSANSVLHFFSATASTEVSVVLYALRTNA